MADLFGCIDRFFCQQGDVLEWGVTAPEPIERPERLTQWLAAGKHGEMAYMQEHAAMRLEPRQFFPAAETIVLFLHRTPTRIVKCGNFAEAQVAAYACGPDYHVTLKRLMRELDDQLRDLDPELQLKMFVDSAPVMERDLAVRAGLGWVGKNGLLLHPRYGSQFFVGGFFINRPLEKTLPVIPDRCGTCRRCLEACPTAAIEENRQINATRCISYLTIEKKGEIPLEFRPQIGNRIFGCDSCQQVCPWNGEHLAEVPAKDSKFNRPLQEWQQVLQPGGGFKRLFKDTPLYRTGRQRMLRNVEIAIENNSPPASERV